MSDRDTADIARATTTVAAPPDRAFAAFTDALGRWWPREFTWSQDVLEGIGLETHQGGLCFEHGPHGFTINWGRVLQWEPPRRLVLAWQITPERAPEPNPAKASEVEVRFTECDSGATRVELVHTGFDRHGEGGADYRAAMADQGWPYLLECYAAAFS